MKLALYIIRRMALAIPQVVLISVLTFMLVRLLPGDPAQLQLGSFATPEAIAALREKMRLDEPLPAQYLAYVRQLVKGDFGRSWVNSSDVGEDLLKRVPATLELITYAILVIVFVMVPLGIANAAGGKGPVERLLRKVSYTYSSIAGALPDFWLALLLVFVFFTTLHIAPGPEGRLSILTLPPPRVTGFYTLDSLLAGQWKTFVDAVCHLVLPVLTLAMVYGAVIYKMTLTTVSAALRSDHTVYARGFGLSEPRILWLAFRSAAPPVVTMTGIVTGYLLGAAVLVETVFNFNGIGQYAVQAIVTADYAPIQAFVLVAAIITLFIYLAVDLVYFVVDPRIRIGGR